MVSASIRTERREIVPTVFRGRREQRTTWIAGKSFPDDAEPWSILLLSLWGYTAALGYLYSRIPSNPDASLFDYVGWVWTQGGFPYRDAADHDFPGMFFLHAIARFLFNSPMWSFRSFDYLLLLAFCGLVFGTISKPRDKLMAVIFVPLYQAMYVSRGLLDVRAARPDRGASCARGGFAVPEEAPGGGGGLGLRAVTLFWSALMIKPTFIVYLPVFLLLDFVTRGRTNRRFSVMFQDQLVAGAVAIGLTAVLLACGWASGSLEKGFDLAIRFNFEVYGRNRNTMGYIVSSVLEASINDWHWYFAYSAIGAYLWWKEGDRPTLLLIFYAVAATAGLYVLQGKGFFYHFSGELPILGLLTANFLAWLVRLFAALKPGDPRRIIVSLPCLLALCGIESKLVHVFQRECLWHAGKITSEEYFQDYGLGDLIRMADFVSSHSKPTDTVWSNNTDILLNVVNERRLPVRFAHPLIVKGTAFPFSRAGQWKEEIEAILRDHPPKFIILTRATDQAEYSYMDHLDETSATRSLIRTMESHYKLVHEVGRFYCFEFKE